MLESQLPSFNKPPTKTPNGRTESASDVKKPIPPTDGETPAGDLAQDSKTEENARRSGNSMGPLAEGYETLDPNVVPPPSQRDSKTTEGGLVSNAPVVDGYGTLQLPDEIEDRIEEPAHGHATDATVQKPGKKRSTTQAPGLPLIPGYVIYSELGKGGMGIVYKAMQKGLKRLVALKMIRKDRATEEAIGGFQDEAKAVARLHHPNIVQIFEIGEFEDQPFFSLEYVEGGSLDKLIKGTPQLPRDSAKLVQTLARAMEVAHAQNIVHRDLKPANVLVQLAPGATVDGTGHIDPSQIIPKITDFGLAKQLDDADLGQTHSGAVLGTPYYMAPEQAEGWQREIKPWTDVYALGAILYELLTARPPFKGATLVETLDQVRQLDPVPPRVLQPSVPRDLETICLKCLRKQPPSRYITAGELAEDLQRFIDDRPILGRPISWRERLVKWAKRSPMAAAAAGVSILLVLSLIGTLFVLMQVAQHDAAEQQRIARTRNQFESRMSEANSKAQLAISEKNPHLWEEVLASTEIANSILDSEESLSDPDLRERAMRLHQQAQREVQGAQERAEKRKQASANMSKLRDCHDTAVVHSVLYTGLTGEQNYQAVEDEVTRALTIFGVNPGEPVPPTLDSEFFTVSQRDQVLDWYYALLLFQAEATFRRAREAKLDDDRRLGIRQALEQLKRADHFRSPSKGSIDTTRSNASLQRRVAYLRLIQDTSELQRVEEQLERTPPARPLDFFLKALDRFETRSNTEKEAQQVRGEVMKLSGDALQIDPDYFGARYLITVCQLQDGNLQVARDQLTACLKEQPKFIWLQLLRGFVWMQLGNLTEAENDFNAARNHPNPKIRYVALVNSSALSTRLHVWDIARLSLSEAIAVMEAGDQGNVPFPYPNYLILLDPSLSSVTSLAATTYLKQGDGGSTTAYINLAIVNKQRAETPWTAYLMLLDPSLGSATALAARESQPVRDGVRRQALQDAVAALDRAIQKNPNSLELLYSERGRLQLDLQDYEKARADFTEAVRLNRKQSVGAATLHDRAKKDRLDLAKLHFRSNNWKDTISECKDLIDRAPEQLTAYQLKANAELAINDLVPARRSLEGYLQEAIRQGIRQVPREELAEVYHRQGVLYFRSRDYRSAMDSCTQGMQLYGKAERRDPQTTPATRTLVAQLCSLRGWAYLAEDVPNLAGKDFDEAMSMDANNADARLGKAESLVRQEKPSEAILVAEEARRVGSRSSRVVFGTARIYAQAYTQAQRGKRPADVKDADVARWAEMAIARLEEALNLEPKEGVPSFWKKNVEGDSAFKPLRNQPAMERLEQRATGTPR